MTKEMEAWIESLNTFGTDIEPPEFQDLLDNEHAKADPEFAVRLTAARLEERAVAALPASGLTLS